MSKMIRYSSISDQYNNAVMIDKILYLSKSESGNTYINLINGEKLESDDSINTLEARINSES